MKKVEAIIRTAKFEEVRGALSEAGILFFSFMEIKSYGKEETHPHYYRGSLYDVGYIARTKIEVVVKDEEAEKVVDIILKHAKTGEVGDGKIFLIDVEKAIRIRNNTVNEAAL
jgi:nitrogen regulatory protein P-II 1